MRSLVMSLFSRDLLYSKLIKVFTVFKLSYNYLQYLHSAWFLDSRTSTLVYYSSY